MKKICLGIIACFFVALIVPFVLSAITGITLSAPANNAWTTDNTPNFNFSAVSNSDATFSCSLYIDGGLSVTNPSVANNTYTVLTAGSALSQGSRSWYINCTDAGGTVQSSVRTLNVDTTAPSVALDSPSNNTETSNHKINFSFKATDNLASSMSCDLYVDGDKEDDLAAQNNSVEEFGDVTLNSGDHTWYVRCSDSAGNSDVSETRTLKIESYCDEGNQGDIDISIEEPDSNDKFYPGENITVEVEISNNYDEDLDITAEAELYDMDDDDSITDAETTVEIDEDDSETVKLYLVVPSNVDEAHDFIIKVKAYEDGNEDEQCDDKTVSIIMDREDNSVIIEDLEMDETAACGETANLDFDIANAGTEDEDNIKVEISSAFFNWEKTLALDSGDDSEISTPIEIPRNITDGNYTITIKTFYDYNSGVYRASETASRTLRVQGNCLGPSTSDASISSSQTDAFVGSSFTVKLAIKNTGNARTNYSVNASGYEGWATLESISPSTITLNAGSTGYVYISLKPDENVVAGTNSFIAVVSFGDTSKEQTIDVEIKKQTEPASVWQRFFFEAKRNWQWACLIVLLVIVIVILAIVLAKQHRHKQRNNRFAPAEIGIRTAKNLRGARKQRNSRVVRNF